MVNRVKFVNLQGKRKEVDFFDPGYCQGFVESLEDAGMRPVVTEITVEEARKEASLMLFNRALKKIALASSLVALGYLFGRRSK